MDHDRFFDSKVLWKSDPSKEVRIDLTRIHSDNGVTTGDRTQGVLLIDDCSNRNLSLPVCTMTFHHNVGVTSVSNTELKKKKREDKSKRKRGQNYLDLKRSKW